MSVLVARRLEFGKRIGEALYVHVSTVERLNARMSRAIEEAVRISEVRRDYFNVVKLVGQTLERVSLLMYQDFDRFSFPALLDSWTVDLRRKSAIHRTYRNSQNPPILHRKELLLSCSDPRRTVFAALTRELEELDLFVDPKSIGFKRQWERRLWNAGVSVVDHEVVRIPEQMNDESCSSGEVTRFRTAIARTKLSAPMQALDRHGFFDRRYSVFDFGCGRGDDLAILTAAGVTASGWDPHFAPDRVKEEADVVNLGFVVNVIEDKRERGEVLRSAFALARRLLSISVISGGSEDTSRLTPYRDGFLSSRGTFQKRFSNDEMKALVWESINVEAIPVGPGVFFAFRDKTLEQEFLECRYRRRPARHPLRQIQPLRASVSPRRTTVLVEENREIIDAFWQRALELGRIPELEELDEEFGHELLATFGSIRKAADAAVGTYGAAELNKVCLARTDDLRLYFAMTQFGRRQRYRELPQSLQCDVRAFFGSYANAEESGRRLLFVLGDRAALQEALLQAQEDGIGHCNGTDSIQLDSRLVGHLPIQLLAYVGCAGQLYGDLEEADLMKIKIDSYKLILSKYQEYESSPLPILRERAKIDLRRQEIYFDNHLKRYHRLLLYSKSRYMTKDLPGYDRQCAFDRKLESLGLIGAEGRKPTLAEFRRILRLRGLAIEGFDLISVPALNAFSTRVIAEDLLSNL